MVIRSGIGPILIVLALQELGASAAEPSRWPLDQLGSEPALCPS